MLKLNVLIAGSTGYIGIQLIKLLINHRFVKIKYLCGNNSVGKNIAFYDKSLAKKKLPKIIRFNKKLLKDIDVIFTALPNGEAQIISKIMEKNNILIDLSGDFRLKKSLDYYKWYNQKHKAVKMIKKSVYSIPELQNEKLKNYNIISCPGCYPTSILLPLVPLIEKNLINTKNIIIDSKSGYSGAGRNVHKKFKDKNLYGSLKAYGIKSHKHNPEINQTLSQYSKRKIVFEFIPHLTPMFRGILSTIYVNLNKNVSYSKIIKVLSSYYKKADFIKIFKKDYLLSTNDVINTNNCYISINKTKCSNKIIILSVIDNLIKGGAGQAIQNLNLRYNFPKKEGLK